MFLLWWLLQIHSNKSTDNVNAIISLCGRPSAVRACRWGCWSSLADGCRQAILPDRCRKPPEFWRLWAPWVPPPYRPYPAPPLPASHLRAATSRSRTSRSSRSSAGAGRGCIACIDELQMLQTIEATTPNSHFLYL